MQMIKTVVEKRIFIIILRREFMLFKNWKSYFATSLLTNCSDNPNVFSKQFNGKHLEFRIIFFMKMFFSHFFHSILVYIWICCERFVSRVEFREWQMNFVQLATNINLNTSFFLCVCVDILQNVDEHNNNQRQMFHLTMCFVCSLI